MVLTIVISTVDKRVLKNSSIMKLSLNENLRIIIVNQKINDSSDLESHNSHCEVINSDSTGISRSRNIGIVNVKNGIVLLGDDDVSYDAVYFDRILKSFEDNSHADVVTFKIITPEGESFKKYSDKGFKHNKRTILKVSSISIAFRIDSIKQRGLKFDEKFGLGSMYVSGEENIFLMEALKAGLGVYYVPETVAIHPKESSGKNLNARQILSKGALFKRIYGWPGFFVGIIFCLIKKRQLNKSGLNFGKSFSLLWKGYSSI